MEKKAYPYLSNILSEWKQWIFKTNERRKNILADNFKSNKNWNWNCFWNHLKSEKEIFCKMLWEQKIDLIISKYILKMDGNWAKIGTFVQRLFGVNTYHFKIRLAIIMTEARNVRFFHPSYSSMFCRDERRVSDLIVMTQVSYDSHNQLFSKMHLAYIMFYFPLSREH